MTAAQQIAGLQQRIQAMEFTIHETERERDALRAEVDQLRAINNNCNEVLERLMERIAALRARLAAAEKVVDKLRRFECGYPDCWTQIDDLIATCDAAKEKTNG